MWEEAREAVGQSRVFERLKALSWTLLSCQQRRTITNMLITGQRQHQDWSADYKIFTVDGGYTNQTVLKNLPANTALIGRIRKDAKFFYSPETQPERGRKRMYGKAAPTPEELRQGESVPW